MCSRTLQTQTKLCLTAKQLWQGGMYIWSLLWGGWRGLVKFLPKEGRWRGFRTDKGEGQEGVQNPAHFADIICTSPPVLRNGSFKTSPKEILHNNHLYEGSQNYLSLSRPYKIDFQCQYHLGFYPFVSMTTSYFEEGNINSNDLF